MIFGTGIDILEISRVEEDLERFGERFENRLFTPNECVYCRQSSLPAEHYAARLAAKEAFVKALGTGKSGGICWTDISVESAPSGKPILSVTGKARELLDSHGIHGMHLSMSHSRNYAVAVVILEI